MPISKPAALLALSTLLIALLVGTQMPGAWRESLEHSMHMPFALSNWAHFVIFAVMAFVSRIPPLAWPVRRVLWAALGLALLTEGLQFLAINRHPGFEDVAIDMAGATLGLLLGWRRRYPS